MKGSAAFAAIVTIAAGLAAAPRAARAQVPGSITFAAHLEQDGVPMTGPHAFGFELIFIDGLGNEISVWAESHGSIVVVDGFVSVELGTVDSLVGDLTKTPLYLDVNVDNVPLAPRIEVTSAPFALRAGEADTLGGKTANQFFQLGTLFLCPAGERMVGLDVAAGNVICGPDPTGGGGGGQTYGAGSGLQLVGNVFSIASGGVVSGHLAPNSVFSTKIINGSILGEDLADGQITGAKIATATITGGNVLGGTLTGTHITDGSIAAADLGPNSVTSNKILDGTIVGADIQGLSIATAHLAPGAVTEAKLANNAVTADKLADNAVDQAAMASNSVGTFEIINGGVWDVDIASGAVKTHHIAGGAVGSDELASSACGMREVDLPMGAGASNSPRALFGEDSVLTWPASPTGPLPGDGKCYVSAQATIDGEDCIYQHMSLKIARRSPIDGVWATTTTGPTARFNADWVPEPFGIINGPFGRDTTVSTSWVVDVNAGQDIEFGCYVAGQTGVADCAYHCAVSYFCQ